jgi:hypothetical protein
MAALLLLSDDSSSAQAQTTSAVLVGAGDIASCDSTGDTATSKLLGSIAGTVLTIGDNAYKEGLIPVQQLLWPHLGTVQGAYQASGW